MMKKTDNNSTSTCEFQLPNLHKPMRETDRQERNASFI
jgi:hypothetical protein